MHRSVIDSADPLWLAHIVVESETIELPGDSGPRKRGERPELFEAAKNRLSWIERANIRFIHKTFQTPSVDRILTLLQRVVGAGWVHVCTRHLRIVHGLDRLPAPDAGRSFILVSNHRSFFDMYVANMVLFRAGHRNRLLFPVRSTFFYDHPLGFLVNGLMSFWSMYPPIFRDRKKASLNHAAFNELILAMKHGGRSAGIHPEGTRKKDDDPYTFLPAQSGVGRAIHQARVPVYPVFIHGLGNDLVRQVLGNFTRKGKKIILVFGAPIDFGTMLDEPGTGRTYKLIADRTLEVIGTLGQEEKRLREGLGADGEPVGAAELTSRDRRRHQSSGR